MSDVVQGGAPGPNRPRIAEAVARALELRDDGRPDWREVILGENPTCAPEIRAALDRLDDLDAALRSEGPDARWRGRCIAGRYELRDWVGAGAMGVVFDGWDRELERRVAVKTMHEGLYDPQRGPARFAVEAEAMASVRHPNLAKVFDRGTTAEGELFLVMEFVDGTTLDDVVSGLDQARDDAVARLASFLDGPPPEHSFLRCGVRWTLDIARGLGEAHARGVVHRDVKPSNIVLGRDGRPVLLDFGIAALEGMKTITRGDSGIGTPAYMAPEVVTGGKTREVSADVYGLVATLYHLVTGRPPYEGEAHEVLAAVATREPVPAARLRPGLPRDLQAILDRGLARRPEQRYGSMSELAADLEAFLEHRPVSARPVTAAERLLRRLVRSRAARGAAVALAVVLAVVLWRGHLDRRARAALDAYAHLPQAFSVGVAAQRPCTSDEEREELGGLLDRIVSGWPSALPGRVLRAAFRRDNGDPRGAAVDMAAVAREVGTPFARALADAYDRGTDGAPIDLDTLPDPGEPEDRYLLAHENLRAGRYRTVMGLLDEETCTRVGHANELRLLGLVETSKDKEAAARRGLEELLGLEEELGATTASIESMRAAMLLWLGRFAEARAHAGRAVSLSPRSWKIRENAGWAAYRDGALDDAVLHLGEAIALRPTATAPNENCIRALADAGSYDQAHAVLDASPFAPDSKEHALCEAIIGVEEALEAWCAGDRDAARALAAAVLAPYVEAYPPDRTRPQLSVTLLERMASGEGSVFAAACEHLRGHPFQWRRRDVLLRLMPDDLTAEETEAMRGVIDDLETYLAARPETHSPDPGVPQESETGTK